MLKYFSTIQQTSRFHKENLEVHTLMCVLYLLECNADARLVEAAFYHDVGKPKTAKFMPEKGGWTFYNHEKKVLTDILDWYEGINLDQVLAIARWHMVPFQLKAPKPWCDKAVEEMDMIERVYGNAFVKDLMLFNKADQYACLSTEELLKMDIEELRKEVREKVRGL